MSAKTSTAPQASGPRVGALLTIAELLSELERAGADPATTTIAVNGQAVVAHSEDWHIRRSTGFVVDLECHHEFEW